MLWITKYKHNTIVKKYQDHIEDLREALNRKESFEKIMDKLVDRTASMSCRLDTCIGSASVMSCLDDTIPRYVPDHFGGKVIIQEATSVTILDEKGKATYAFTAEKADKGRTYKLVQN